MESDWSVSRRTGARSPFRQSLFSGFEWIPDETEFVVGHRSSGIFTFVISEKTDSSKNWKERWMTVSDEGNGGQSETKRVRSKTEDSPERFLKILLHQNDPLRRNRMFREVACYRTLNHPSIPKLIETNVDRYEDLQYKLYLVTELIEGATLEPIIEDKGPLPADVGIPLVIRLLEVVDYCHNNDTVHRDIKPDNILLKHGDPTALFLVDFGLSFNKNDPPQAGTPSNDELGNRFCRLPELASSSRAKRDPRSDVTFCAGILLYVLTSCIPAVLMDEQGEMPHQRGAMKSALSSLSADLRSSLLLLFDRAFQQSLSNRWQTAADLREELTRLMEPPSKEKESYDALRERVHAYTRQPHIQEATQIHASIEAALNLLNKLSRRVRDEEGGKFEYNQAGSDLKAQSHGGIWLALSNVAKKQPVEHWIKFRVEAIGPELVISAIYKDSTFSLWRTDLSSPTYGREFENRVKELFYRQMADVIA